MGPGDTEHLAKPRDVPNPQPAAVDEVHDLRRFTETHHVRCQHPAMRRQRGNDPLGAQHV